jgi:hypothetical protein
MGEARYFPAGIILVDDAALSRSHNDRLCRLESRKSGLAVAALDRFFDFANRIFSTERRPLFTSVRRAITRVALRADLVLAIDLSFAAGAFGGYSRKRLGFTRSYGGENSRRQG